MARHASTTLRCSVFSRERYRLRTSSCVIVEPPEGPVLRPGAGKLDGPGRLGDPAVPWPPRPEGPVAPGAPACPGGPLDDVARADIGNERAEDPHRIDAAVLVEAPVLDGDR